MYQKIEDRPGAYRALRKFAAVTMITGVVVLATITTAYAVVYRSITPASVEEIASTALARPVTVGELSFAGWRGIRLANVAIGDSIAKNDTRTLARFNSVLVRPSFWSLLKGRVEIASVTSKGGELYLRRPGVDRGLKWNLESLIGDMPKGGDKTGPRARMHDLTVIVEEPSGLFNRARIECAEIDYDPATGAASAEISSYNSSPAKIRIAVDGMSGRAKVESRLIPPALLGLLIPGATADELELKLELDIDSGGTRTVNGGGRAEGVAYRTADGTIMRLDRLALHDGRLRMSMPDKKWSASVSNLEIGTGRDRSSFDGMAIGSGERIVSGKFSASGAIENLLKLAPPAVSKSAARFAPRGPLSAVVEFDASGTKIDAKLDGLGLIIPKGTEIASSAVREDLRIDEVKGRLRADAEAWRFDGMTVRTGKGVIGVEGIVRTGGPLPDYALALHSGGIDGAYLSPFLSEAGEIRGSVAFDLDASPGAAHGTVSFDGASLKLTTLRNELLDLKGSISFARDRVATEELSFSAGSTRIEVSGAVTLDAVDPRFHDVRISAPHGRIEEILAVVPDGLVFLPQGSEIEGEIAIDELAVDGRMASADWLGRVVVTNARGRLPALERGVEAVSGVLRFDRSTLRADELSGKIGGSVSRIEGTLGLRPPYDLDLKIGLNAANIRELFRALPQAESLDSLGIDGRAIVTARVRIRDGRFSLAGGLSDADLKGFGMDFRGVKGDFGYEDATRTLTLKDLAGQWAGGRTSGGMLSIGFASDTPSYRASGEFQGADLGIVLPAAGLATKKIQGVASGSFDVRGLVGDRRSVSGTASVEIAEGRFEELKPLESIARTLTLDIFSRESYQRIKGEFRAEAGKIHTVEPKHLRIHGKNYLLEAAGYTSMDGTYVYNYECGIDAGATGRLLTALPVGISGNGEIIRKRGTIQGKL